MKFMFNQDLDGLEGLFSLRNLALTKTQGRGGTVVIIIQYPPASLRKKLVLLMLIKIVVNIILKKPSLNSTTLEISILSTTFSFGER